MGSEGTRNESGGLHFRKLVIPPTSPPPEADPVLNTLQTQIKLLRDEIKNLKKENYEMGLKLEAVECRAVWYSSFLTLIFCVFLYHIIQFNFL